MLLIQITRILLGRNFMKLYWNVTFDFRNARIKLGDLVKSQPDRVNRRTVIPARSETMVEVACSDLGLTTGDFDAKYYGINGIHVARAQVSPNLNGTFYITLLNVSNQDTTISNRKLIGFVHPTGKKLSCPSCSFVITHFPEDTKNAPFKEVRGKY